MEETTVRQHAEDHGQAVVDGDLRKAGSDLTKEGLAAAGTVNPKLPRPVTGATVLSVVAAGDEFVATIHYTGDDAEATVESRWAERDRRPMIVDMKIV